MISIWFMAAPVAAFGIVAIIFFSINRLHFFSRRSRHLDEIDIPNEVREIRINELEGIGGSEADWIFRNAWKINRWERRQVIANRHRRVRKWLYLIISNCALFCEVARFHTQEADSAEGDSAAANTDLPDRVLDRATTVQLMAVICLGKLLLLDCCRLVRPFYVPQISDRFLVGGHDLMLWYRHLAKEMLELAQHYYDDVTFTRFILQLTGACSIEEAVQVNRL